MWKYSCWILLDLCISLLVHLLLSPWVLSAVFMVKVEAKLWLAVCSLSSYTRARTHGISLVFDIGIVIVQGSTHVCSSRIQLRTSSNGGPWHVLFFRIADLSHLTC